MAFNLSGILSLNNSGFISGMNQAGSASDKLSGKVKGAGGAIKGMIVGAAAIAGIGLGIKDVADVYVGFQKEMSNTKALADEFGGVTMKDLSEKAKEMGRILPASATDAAKAMSNLGSAGFNTKEIFDSIEGTLYLATSAQTDMATAADITSSTLRGFGLEAGKSGHVADVLAMTAAKTNAGILDMGESLKYSAPVAHSFGIKLEEVAAATGIMANAGIKGSQSGTTLRTAMVRLTKVGKPAQKAMDSIGFSAFDSAGKMNPLSKIVGDLKESTKGLTQEQKNQKISAIFGTEALSGMLTLVDAGPEKMNALTTALEKSDGAAKAMAETQTDNLYGALQQVEGAFETLKIEIGEKAAPAITAALKGFADYIPIMSTAVLGGLDGLIGFASGIVTAVTPTLTSLKDFIMTQVVPRFRDIGTVMSDLYTTYQPLLSAAFDLLKTSIGAVVTGGLDLLKIGLQFFNDNSGLTTIALTLLGTAFAIYGATVVVATAKTAAHNVVTGISFVKGMLLLGVTSLLKGAQLIGAAATAVATAAMWLWNAAMAAGAAPVILIIAGVALLAAGIVYAYKHFDTFRSIVDTVWSALKKVGEVIGGVLSSIGKFIGKVGSFVTGAGKMETASGKANAAASNTGVPHPKIVKKANGTAYASGGSTLVNERGGEMQILRNGTSIIPAEKTDRLLKGDNSSGGNNVNINIDAKGMSVDELVTQLKLRLANI